MTRTVLTMFVFSTFSALFLLASPGKVYACSCLMPSDPLTSLEESDAVFRGTVTAVNAGDDVSSNTTVVFQVEEIWKADNVVKLESIETAGDSAGCGYNFEVGNEYIVYASDVEGVYSTSLCSRTTLVADAAEDIAALGQGEFPATIISDDSGEEQPEIISDTSTEEENDNNDIIFYSLLGGGITLGLIALGTILYYVLGRGSKAPTTNLAPEPVTVTN